MERSAYLVEMKRDSAKRCKEGSSPLLKDFCIKNYRKEEYWLGVNPVCFLKKRQK